MTPSTAVNGLGHLLIWTKAALLALLICLFALPLAAQSTDPAATPSVDRSATGGAQTLEDILARQRGEKLDDEFRRSDIGDPSRAADPSGQLGVLGGVSDAEMFRALRYGSADIRSSSEGPASTVVIQDSGMAWLTFREGPLAKWGAYSLGGMLLLLLLFYLLRGKIRIDGDLTGRKLLRFSSIERFGHWLMAGSFILLAITGLLVLFGRKVMIPWLGHEAYAGIAMGSKWIHNNVSWAFMIGLALVIVMWVLHNIPNRHDLVWLAKGGGLFSKGVHPPARKFNAGQKVIFWAVVLLGISISASGLSLLFPFEMPLFAKTFVLINQTGLPELFGIAPLPETLGPYQEMQLAQVWHTMVAFAFIAIILAHIYLGSVGMEGAFDAMGSGEVEEQWAREHHGLWVEELEARERTASGHGQPAE